MKKQCADLTEIFNTLDHIWSVNTLSAVILSLLFNWKVHMINIHSMSSHPDDQFCNCFTFENYFVYYFRITSSQYFYP